MIYTIGYIPVYEKYIATDKKAAKRKGGSVWKSKREAIKHTNDKFGVYGVIARWGIDTEIDEFGEGWHKLKKNCKLIKL